MTFTNRYFGNADQQGLEQRADHLWRIVAGDPRYSCHGRAVALISAGAKDVDLQIALARLQGVGPSPRLTPEVAEAREAAIRQAGLVTDVYEHWSAGADVVATVQGLLEKRSLPDELTVREVDVNTSDQDYDRLDALTGSCGVLLPASAFLSGRERPAVCLYACTRDGEIVGAAAAIAENPPASTEAGRVWWGMLSTADAWRGQGVAKLLGAMALVAMIERYDVTGFGTGIREGNAASARLCAGLGFAPSGLLDLMAIDPVTMSGGRMTK